MQSVRALILSCLIHRVYPGQHLDFHGQHRKRVNPLGVCLFGTIA